MKKLFVIIIPLILGICGCSSMYYGAMEKIGIHKRDIMVDRVKDARDTQEKTKDQFVSAMEQFKGVVNFQGGDLEREYNKFNKTLQQSESGAKAVHDHIEAVENVSKALFKEWRNEMKQYTSKSLRAASQKKYDVTKSKYDELIATMKIAESRLEPVLSPLRDQVLFMKHNLNAKAIAGLSGEVVSVQSNVDQLVSDMELAIAQADSFIASLETE